AGGAGDYIIFGKNGDDRIQGDGSTAIDVGTRAAPGTSSALATDGNDYVEGGPGNDLIFGGLGQDDLIGGNSSLYLPAGAPRPDGADTIFGGNGAAIGLNDAGDGSATGHARDADVIAGDNALIYRLVNASGQFLTFNYDPYSALRIVPRAVSLLDYSPYGDTSYVANNPA